MPAVTREPANGLQVTKVDICPAHVLEHTLATLSAILRKPGVRLKPFMVRAVSAFALCRHAKKHC